MRTFFFRLKQQSRSKIAYNERRATPITIKLSQITLHILVVTNEVEDFDFAEIIGKVMGEPGEKEEQIQGMIL